jgi:hypothetical protein
VTDCFDVAGLLRVIVKRFAEFPDGSVEAIFKDYGCIRLPKVFLNLPARDHLPRALSQVGQEAKGLVLDGNFVTVTPQLSRGHIHFEAIKAKAFIASGPLHAGHLTRLPKICLADCSIRDVIPLTYCQLNITIKRA